MEGTSLNKLTLYNCNQLSTAVKANTANILPDFYFKLKANGRRFLFFTIK